MKPYLYLKSLDAISTTLSKLPQCALSNTLPCLKNEIVKKIQRNNELKLRIKLKHFKINQKKVPIGRICCGKSNENETLVMISRNPTSWQFYKGYISNLLKEEAHRNIPIKCNLFEKRGRKRTLFIYYKTDPHLSDCNVFDLLNILSAIEQVEQR